MKVNEVPQDITYYEGEKRACYALNEQGKYVIVTSAGWSAEEVVNGMAVAELAAHLEKTRKEVLAGLKSPLYYHMEQRQMTPAILAKTAGICRLRLRRHFKAPVFARLSAAVLERYARALALTIDELKKVPEKSSGEKDTK
ncbi:MAG TPA: helix-turn-helix transcriptional regulator [Smithellaceae bacterium]|nr:helix-turn-helix transcriptional regulator [Smithellaceae bacterium]